MVDEVEGEGACRRETRVVLDVSVLRWASEQNVITAVLGRRKGVLGGAWAAGPEP